MKKGQVHTDESRRKMSDSHTGVPLSLEHCASMSRPMSDKNRAALSDRMQGNKYNQGRSHSLETRAKMSAAHTGVPLSLARRVALSDSHFILISGGYPYLKFLGRWVSALRVAYTFFHGPIPEGRRICPTNGDPLDCSEDNLKALTKREHFNTHKFIHAEELAV